MIYLLIFILLYGTVCKTLVSMFCIGNMKRVVTIECFKKKYIYTYVRTYVQYGSDIFYSMYCTLPDDTDRSKKKGNEIPVPYHTVQHNEENQIMECL